MLTNNLFKNSSGALRGLPEDFHHQRGGGKYNK
jgi:hypothetical protein